MSERPEFETVERWMNAHARRAHQGTGVEVAECQSSCVPAFAALDSLRAYVEELEDGIELIERRTRGCEHPACKTTNETARALTHREQVKCLCGHGPETHHYTPTPVPRRGECHARKNDGVGECDCQRYHEALPMPNREQVKP